MRFSVILETLILLLFPILVYFLFLSIEEYSEEKKKLFLKVAIYVQAYLLILFKANILLNYPVTMLAIPMAIALYKKYFDTYIILAIAKIGVAAFA